MDAQIVNIAMMDNQKLLISPSILAADFANLGGDIAAVEAAGADLLHVDVMDGHFVPNISIGPPVINSARKVSNLCFDVHLMIERPDIYLDSFIKAGANHITFHAECAVDVRELVGRVHAAGCSAGLCLKPQSPFELVAPFLDQIDLVLVMTVEPGFGGQSFMVDMMPKVREVREAIAASGRNIHLEVDGGIDVLTVGAAAAAGANMMVAGTSVFRHPKGVDESIRELRAAATTA